MMLSFEIDKYSITGCEIYKELEPVMPKTIKIINT